MTGLIELKVTLRGEIFNFHRLTSSLTIMLENRYDFKYISSDSVFSQKPIGFYFWFNIVFNNNFFQHDISENFYHLNLPCR